MKESFHCLWQIISCNFIFHLKYFRFSLQNLFLTYMLINSMLFNAQEFKDFLAFYYWFLIYISWALSICTSVVCYFFLHSLGCILWPWIWKFHVTLGKGLFLDSPAHRSPFHPADWWLCLLCCPFTREVLKSPSVSLSTFLCSSGLFYFDATLSGMQTVRFVHCSWRFIYYCLNKGLYFQVGIGRVKPPLGCHEIWVRQQILAWTDTIHLFMNNIF